ncbi:hypothetical protein, partial [Neisseria gonorrhoeae]|uniref:hypothetical protein n=1 Tax=Neisseria gonorrhoeae TaxID=485 RepID=UPI001C998A81
NSRRLCAIVFDISFTPLVMTMSSDLGRRVNSGVTAWLRMCCRVLTVAAGAALALACRGLAGRRPPPAIALAPEPKS